MTLPLWHFDAVKAEYPRWALETPAHYTERLSILAGALPREEAGFVGPDEDIKAGQGTPAESSWLPYRDSE